MKGLKPLRVDGGFNRLTEILPALRDTDGGLLTTRWIADGLKAVLNADSVDSTADDKLSEQY